MKRKSVPAFTGRVAWIATLLLFVGIAASAQNFHQLVLNDFQGPAGGRGQNVVAYTNCTINYKYVAYPMNGYYRLDFIITLQLNNDKSFVDRSKITSSAMLADVLTHEQGHYTIAFMEQQELLRTVGRTVFYADYQSKAKQIFSTIDAKYQELNTNYDDDTQHMVNRTQQASWNAYFKKRLAFMPGDEAAGRDR